MTLFEQYALDLDTVQWPEPQVVLQHKDAVVHDIKVNLKLYSSKSWPARLKILIQGLYQYADVLIPLAEVALSELPGQEKKNAVTAALIRLLRQAEEELDVLPTGIQTVVFTVLGYVSDAVVENAFQRLGVK